jgi:hypothetical protein
MWWYVPIIPVNYRFNNIGVRNPDFAGEGVQDNETLCVVKYHPNGYYGMLEEYLRSGWADAGDSLELNNVKINKNTFAEKESYYVLALVRVNPEEDYTRLEGVEDRLAWIEEHDYVDFFRAYRQAVYSLTGIGQMTSIQSGAGSPALRVLPNLTAEVPLE